MTGRLTIHTYDWVPEGPRGFVRDMRLRWAAEEAALPYDVRAVPFEQRGPEHFQDQPFGQVPFLTDGDLTIFESGAGLLHLARKSEALMPRDPAGEAAVLQWVIAALNSIEIVTLPWWYLRISGHTENGMESWMDSRLAQLETIMAARDWLVADRFTVADLIMADVLRIPAVRAHGDRPATEAYIARATARPAFLKAHADQIAYFAAADDVRAEHDAN